MPRPAYLFILPPASSPAIVLLLINLVRQAQVEQNDIWRPGKDVPSLGVHLGLRIDEKLIFLIQCAMR